MIVSGGLERKLVVTASAGGMQMMPLAPAVTAMTELLLSFRDGRLGFRKL